MIDTAIEWCDDTLNLWWGCTKVSDGCRFCYAESLSNRLGRQEWGPNGTRTEVKSWRSTLAKIRRKAEAEGRRRRVFVNSMADTFEGPETCGGYSSENWNLISGLRRQLFEVITDHPMVDFLVLTKRPHNIFKYGSLPVEWGDGMPSNLWIGTSVEDQKTADERIPHLLQVPAAVRFLSCEPLLGPVEFCEEGFVCEGCGFLLSYGIEEDAANELPCPKCGCYHYVFDSPSNKATLWSGDSAINWVICGGESGRNARPMHPDWVRSLRDQCQAAGVPFFFKQWGEWRPPQAEEAYDTSKGRTAVRPGFLVGQDGTVHCFYNSPFADAYRPMIRVGKKAAGRFLDGQEWSEMPGVES